MPSRGAVDEEKYCAFSACNSFSVESFLMLSIAVTHNRRLYGKTQGHKLRSLCTMSADFYQNRAS
ncbi:protein of unknown function [Vibrio tapetis subsp. tapetis]|uniref:Uncharacterized protein n=1 Tax=Vibrio tapetis subsp. tapetis TaxID=1671868 RepID=A0A2N8ZJ59_9VIBR|nr:protein of unknown function [Vibrio tapetis subsp. tapetis]